MLYLLMQVQFLALQRYLWAFFVLLAGAEIKPPIKTPISAPARPQ